MNTSPYLHLEALEIRYPGAAQAAVREVELKLARGEIGVLLGASGSGKTSLLRALAGFEPLAAGRITLAGQCLAEAGRGLPPEVRRLGMMFQDFALFPHLDVAGNIGFGLHRLSKSERHARVQQWLQRVELAGFAERYPHELSGGQQQRVALARALAPAPALVLLDEPFSALDADTRQRLLRLLRHIFRAAGSTVLMVTHDQEEAFALGDKVGVMSAGRLLQWDCPAQLYRQPATPEVAGFIGHGTLLPAAVLGLPGMETVLLRPEHLCIDPAGALLAEVLDLRFVGPGCRARLRLAHMHEIDFTPPADATLAPGQRVHLALTTTDLPRFASAPPTCSLGLG